MSEREHVNGVSMVELDRQRLRATLDDLRTLSRETLETTSDSLAQIAGSLGQTGDESPETVRCLLGVSRLLYILAYETSAPSGEN